jgi:hypothetical protein
VRFVIVLLLAVAGCVATLPDDPTIMADLAVESARAIIGSRKEKPDDPKPQPGDKCPDCNGLGYVGDGTVRVKCVPCDGTGRVK